MPRKPRIEYAGAVYHVLNRGNYRQTLFEVEGTAEAFERVLLEACSRFGWRLHAYVILSNHYHACIKTSDANLVTGMQWLQSTFANRFNRFVGDRGHVFQGRYKALLVEEGPSLLRVVNYIHLNPVRAGIKSIESLKEYPYGSFPKYFRRHRPACLEAEDWLLEAGHLQPTAQGFRCYHQSLALAVESDPQKRSELYRQLCRGWYVGTREGKKALLKDVQEGSLSGIDKLRGFGEERAEVLLAEGLALIGKDLHELVSDLKLAPWKVTLAGWIKLQCGVSNRWLSENMNMGSIYSISKAVSAELKHGNRRSKIWKKLGTPKSKA